ncbi:unnamed protein product [Heterobilharzia americana]|nr:unnamed protein product [Heterobilharzia americana]
MSYPPKAPIVHENITNGESGLDKRKLFDINPPFGDIDDIYLSSAGRDSPVSVVMSERVQRIASGIYREFETMIEAYGLPVVERLMPLIIGLLENLDDLYKDQAAYHAEVGHLREENEHVFDQLTAEKAARKQSELRLLHAEDAFDEERKANDAKNETLSTSCRQMELKLQLAKDQVSRLEAKEQEWKKEESRLHERLNELIRSNVELTEQIKFVSQQNNTNNSHNNNGNNKNTLRKLSIGSPQFKLIGSTEVEKETSIYSQPSDTGYDATSGGFGFDEMPSHSEVDTFPIMEDDLPASMRKEIDVLIKENMDLVETKNALNVVKDDLLAKIDYLTSENISLRESVDMLTLARVNLQGELTSTDQMLSDARSEINQLNEKLSACLESKNEESSNSSQRKRFTRSEMARILAERNHYKERLLELQDAVRFTETLRIGQKGHPDLLSKVITPQQKCDSITPVTGPLQSLQKFFAAFTSGQRSEAVPESMQNVESGSSVHSADISLSWITLSTTGTYPPIYGWASGNDSDVKCNSQQYETNINTGSDDKNDDSQYSIPVPVQCRTIGGLHRKHLEICTALTVPIVSLDNDSKIKFHLWLIGRGGPADSHLTDSSLSLNRGYLGQVHIFEPTRFTQPVYSFDLDNGFLPSAAVCVKCTTELTQPSTKIFTPELTSDDAKIEFSWDFSDLSNDNCDKATPKQLRNDLEGHCVILASNDGRFLVFQPCYEIKSNYQSALVDTTSSIQDGIGDSEKCMSSKNNPLCSTSCSIRLPQILYRFNTDSQGLVANAMISCDNHICIGLFNSLGVSQFVCFQWPLFTESMIRNSSNSTSIKTTHKLINLPYNSLSTGPLIMTSNTCNDNKDNEMVDDEVLDDHIWFGTAGGGYCHCLAVRSGKFITSLALPSETPCLHAICIKSSTRKSSKIIWLAVSGNPVTCSPSKKSFDTTRTGDDDDDDNNNNNDSNNEEKMKKVSGVSGGMARLLACCPQQKCILRQIDLTSSLSSMLDMEGVTDPIDLTICRLLIVPMTADNEIWFATRSGLIARLRLDYSVFFTCYFADKNESEADQIELSKSSSVLISCHGYRRPVCNLLLMPLISQVVNTEEFDYLIVSVGHDYVDLRPILSAAKKSDENPIHSYDRVSSVINHVNRSRQMGSGAHAIVWRLTEACN